MVLPPNPTVLLGEPVELHPNLRARLAGTAARLDELVSALGVDRMTTRPVDASWSIQENAGHLADLEPLWFRRFEDFAAGREVLTEADLTNHKTNAAGHNKRQVADILSEFRRRRLAWVSALDSSTPDAMAASALHPRLRQPLRLLDLMLFVAEHDDHHLARIRELLRS